MYDLVIVGGGFSGLSAAFFAKKQGLSFRLLESSDRLGGVLGSQVISGYTVEQSANTFIYSPVFAEMLDELGLQSSIHFVKPASRYICLSDRLLVLPTSFAQFFRSELLSLRAKACVARGLFFPSSVRDEECSIADFFRQRFGRMFEERIVNPFVAGIWAGSSDDLSMDACFPEIKRLISSKGPLIRRLVQSKSKQKEKQFSPPKTFVFLRGSDHFLQALSSHLGSQALIRQRQVQLLEHRQGVFSVQSNGKVLKTKRVIITTPIKQIPDIVDPLFASAQLDELRSGCQQISYVPLTLVYLGLAKTQQVVPEGVGFLRPQVDQKKGAKVVLGCLFSSHVWAGRAPDDHHLLTVFVGGAGIGDTNTWEDSRLVSKVCGELSAIFQKTVEPTWSHVIRWEQAIPQYTLGHQNRVSKIQSILSCEGLFFHGNWNHGVALSKLAQHSQLLIENISQTR